MALNTYCFPLLCFVLAFSLTVMCIVLYINNLTLVSKQKHTVATQGCSTMDSVPGDTTGSTPISTLGSDTGKPGVRRSGAGISGCRPHRRQRAAQVRLMSGMEDGHTIKGGPALPQGGSLEVSRNWTLPRSTYDRDLTNSYCVLFQ